MSSDDRNKLAANTNEDDPAVRARLAANTNETDAHDADDVVGHGLVSANTNEAPPSDD